jgi:cupin 2 domain-containing protein
MADDTEKISQFCKTGSSAPAGLPERLLISRIRPSMISHGHFLQDAASGLPDEIVEVMLSGRDVRIERIVSHGQASPPGYWYDQDEHEWVMLLEGEAALRFEGDQPLLRMTPGMHVHIPAHARHRVESTAPDRRSIWLAVFYR